MSNQLDLVKASRKAPLYETIRFADFHPAMQGELTYRVNLTRAMWREMAAIQDLNTGLASLEKDSDAYKAQETDVNARSLAFIASLIPRDSAGGEPITREELQTLLDSAAELSDEEDVFFDSWLIDELMRRVGEYQRVHFLARVKSNGASSPTPIP